MSLRWIGVSSGRLWTVNARGNRVRIRRRKKFSGKCGKGTLVRSRRWCLWFRWLTSRGRLFTVELLRLTRWKVMLLRFVECIGFVGRLRLMMRARRF